MKAKWLPWLGFVLLFPSLLINIFLYQKSQKENTGILVLEVLDGDTLLLEREVRLRLREIDAPEVALCGGEKPKRF